MRTLHDLPENKIFRKQLRTSGTKAEAVLWLALKGKKLGYKFRRQHGIGPYIVDFYCSEKKLIIEVDGSSHQDEVIHERDKIRQKYLEDFGFKVIRFTNEEVLKDRDTVVINIKIGLGVDL